MLRRAVEAFITGDVEAARAIPAEDDAVDVLYNEVNTDLVKKVTAEPWLMPMVNLFSWAAHNIERTADRSTNICERTIFTATGELLELDSQDNEDTE